MKSLKIQNDLAFYVSTDLEGRSSRFWKPERILEVKGQADDVVDSDVRRISETVCDNHLNSQSTIGQNEIEVKS